MDAPYLFTIPRDAAWPRWFVRHSGACNFAGWRLLSRLGGRLH